jgi:hypothetical protein
MGLTVIPTETSGSLGTDKVDRYPRATEVDEQSADEWNVAKRAIAELSAAEGLGDGTTPGSSQAQLRELNAPASGADRFAVVDDFDTPPPTGAGRWLSTVSSGSYSYLGADSAPQEGFGWLRLTSGGGAGNFSEFTYALAELFKPDIHATTAQPLELRARVKLPASLANTVVKIGFRNAADTIRCLLTTDVSAQWVADTASVAGGGSGTTVGTGTPVAGTVYDVLIVITGTTATFYIDGVLVATRSGTSIPQGADIMTALLRCEFAATATGSLDIDYVSIRGAR